MLNDLLIVVDKQLIGRKHFFSLSVLMYVITAGHFYSTWVKK
jgi:hypothetical protein